MAGVEILYQKIMFLLGGGENIQISMEVIFADRGSLNKNLNL